jgi:transposase
VIHAAEQRRPDVALARRHWRDEVMPSLASDRIVFLDETGTKTNMTRSHGYAPRGQRLQGEAPYRRWQTTTFVGALRADGLLAPLVVDGAMTGELFVAYVRQVLVPELHRGDTVVLDNLSCHTLAAVRQAIEEARCRVLYLPPYSPDLNPIELAFSKLKRLLRRAAARTTEALWQTLGSLLDCFGAQECANYIRHCGYTATRSRKAL